PSDLGDDSVDNLAQVFVIAKLDVGFLQLAAPLHINLEWAVDQDIADRGVLEQDLERPKTERFIEYLVDEALALHAVEERVFGVAQALDNEANFAAERIAGQVAHAREIQLVHELAVDQPLELLEALVALARRG